MQAPTYTNLGMVSALAGILSGREFRNLKVEIGPSICYVPKTDTIIIPGLPFGQLDPVVSEDLFAYLAHEAAGERGESTWNPEDYEDGHRMLVNGMNDARIDRIVLRKWPGAGLAIRRNVERDFQKALASGINFYNVTALAVALRYMGEGVATVEDVRKLKGLSPLLDIALPHVEGIDWDGSEAHIIERATRIWEALQTPPPPPTPEPTTGKDEGGEPDEESEGESDGEGDGTGADRDDSEDDSGDDSAGTGGESGDSDSEDEGEGAAGDAGAPSGGDEVDGDRAEADEADAGRDGAADEAEAEGAVEGRSATPVPLGDGKTVEDRAKDRLQEALGGTHAPVGFEGTSAVFSYNPRIDHFTVERGNVSPKPGLVHRFVSLFAALRDAEGREIVHKQHMGELDLERLPLALGGVTDTVHYRRRRAASEKMAVYASADFTGSLRYFKTEYCAMLASLSAALRRLDVPHEITGWTGGEYDDVRYTQPYRTRFHHFKRFEDKGEARMSDTVMMANNADAPALIEAYQRIMQRTEAGRLVLHFTDGLPCIDGYNSEPQRIGAMRQALHLIVKQMRASSIDIVGIGVNMSDNSNGVMNHIFGEGYWVPCPSLSTVDLGFARGVQSVVRRMREGRRA